MTAHPKTILRSTNNSPYDSIEQGVAWVEQPEEKTPLNKRGLPKQTPFINPLTQVQRALGPNASVKEVREVLADAIEKEATDVNHKNYKIAIAIQPKKKGWAWHRRTGAPLNFSEPSQTTALINWASSQPWWQEPMADDEKSPHQCYVHLAMEAAESKAGSAQVAEATRDLVARALESQKVNNGIDKPAAGVVDTARAA